MDCMFSRTDQARSGDQPASCYISVVLPSPSLPLLRRCGVLAGLFLVLIVAALLPARPVLKVVWPFPVEEIVFENGRWGLQRTGAPVSDVHAHPRRARTRPRSVAAVQMVDGTAHYGYVLAPSANEGGYLLLLIDPDRQLKLAWSEIDELFYPNELTLLGRARRALSGVIRRDPALP